jgi:hypothetical protein
MRTRFAVSLLVAGAALVVASRAAEARHVKFLGPHPIASKFGGGYCYIESPHLHVYAPDRPVLYQQVGDQYVFTGDPTPFGYDGDRHQFYGHHPVVTVGAEPVYCYINGPHFHAFAAPAAPEYKMENGVAFYVGPYPPSYARMKPQRMRVVNAEYRPFASYRPVVQVQPPTGWQGEVYVAPPEVQVTTPGVYVAAPPPPRATVVVGGPPPPAVSVQVSAPGVYVPPPPRATVYVGAPPPPRATVVVGAPPPPGVVVVGGPPPPGVVVVGAPHGKREHWEHENEGWRGHHDNGKHKGWYK